MVTASLDLDILRTLVAADRLGGFGRAAGHVGRSQSAVSQQVRRIEAQLGVQLFQRQGRGLIPTQAGEILLAHARRLLSLNDDTIAAVRGCAVEGAVRLGLPGDLADGWLPHLLGRFKRAHPEASIEVAVERNGRLLERLDEEAFDLVLALGADERPDASLLTSYVDVWVGSRDSEAAVSVEEPVSLAVLEAPCMFRKSALAALDRAGMPWRIAFTSPSLHGLWAAVEAGLGVTVRTPAGLPAGVRVIGSNTGLPPLGDARRPLCLHNGNRQLSAAGERLVSLIRETFQT